MCVMLLLLLLFMVKLLDSNFMLMLSKGLLVKIDIVFDFNWVSNVENFIKL